MGWDGKGGGGGGLIIVTGLRWQELGYRVWYWNDDEIR